MDAEVTPAVISRLLAEIDRLRDENDRLREALEEVDGKKPCLSCKYEDHFDY